MELTTLELQQVKAAPVRASSGSILKMTQIIAEGKKTKHEYIGIEAKELGISCITMAGLEQSLINAGLVVRPAEGKTKFAPFYRILPTWRDQNKPASSNILKVAIKVN